MPYPRALVVLFNILSLISVFLLCQWSRWTNTFVQLSTKRGVWVADPSYQALHYANKHQKNQSLGVKL